MCRASRQVLANLLNNAAKYTEKKGRIAVEANEEDGQAVIRVRDSGIGIPAESQATIFELFRQLGHAPDRPEGGLGVGLTLVKRLVEMHGGTIEAHSEGHGKGSEFALRLPLLSEAEKDLGVRARAPARAGEAPVRKRRRILVADDNVDLAASMGLLLEMMGNDVRVTHDGSAAVNVETEFRPDVVFLDIGMTKMNGFDACTRIRGKPWGKEPVIVALTGWGQPEDKRRSREAGFDHHLVKPIEPAALERFLMDIES
jgi:CheY-like chemotaxis protein